MTPVHEGRANFCDNAQDCGSGVVANPFLTEIQSSNIPILIVDVVAGENIIAMTNASFVRMIGDNHSEILGKSISYVFRKVADHAAIEYFTRRISQNLLGSWDVDLRRSDGGVNTLSILMSPLRDEASVLGHYILSFHEVAGNHVLSLDNLELSRKFYENAPDFIATSSGPQHLITFANKAYKLFVGYNNFVGKTVAEAMPEIAAQGFVKILDRVFETGTPFHGKAIPFEFTDPESGAVMQRFGNFVYEPVRDHDGTVVGIFCEGYDITEQRQAELKVELLNAEFAHSSRVNAMGTMAATLAHELNQPLTAIANYSAGCIRLIESGAVDLQAIKEAAVASHHAANRAGAIIRTLRDLTDRRVRSCESFLLKAAVLEAVNLVRLSCSLETQIDVDIPDELTLLGNRVQIQQVIINLISNGCDAVAQSSTQKITISTTIESGKIVVSVGDTGPGISEQTVKEIFSWSDSSKESGMGLGLAICRTIVEAHGGRIWLEKSDAKGTEFCFTVPHVGQ